MDQPSAQITKMLQEWGDGDPEALDHLMPLVFDDLRRMASRYLRHESPDLLQSTALVNEVFLRLLQKESLQWQNRGQFFGFVAQEMRRILVDYARKRTASRRGGGQRPVSLEEALTVADAHDIDLAALDDALRDLSEVDPNLSRIVELRFFVGLSHQEIAEIQSTSVATVRRQWTQARTWLFRQLRADDRRTEDGSTPEQS